MKTLLAVLALAGAACTQQEADGSRPPGSIELTGRVVDQAGLIDTATEATLTQRLAALEARTSDQLVVVTVPTLAGQPIEKYSLNLANAWGVGDADLDNGVLLMVAPNERKVRIEVGLGLEGLLTDAKAAEVIELMLPHFREGGMQQGITTGIGAIDHLLSSDKRRPQLKQTEMRQAA